MDSLRKDCPWHQPYTIGAFAADSIARLLDDKVRGLLAPFCSDQLQHLIRLRRGVTLDFSGVEVSEEARFAGAVLAKLAQRGFPAPCSLELERFLLTQAKEVGLLNYTEHIEAGTFVFHVDPGRQWRDLSSFLKACFFAELLLDDEETEGLLDRYRDLCTEPEREFYELVSNHSSDPRLALFLTPQRLIMTMLRLTRPQEELQVIAGDRRVDFAVELPKLGEKEWLRLIVEIDDPSHEDPGQQALDKQRDKILKSNGWRVQRLSVNEKASWNKAAQKLAHSLGGALTDRVLSAAKAIREFPEELRQALRDLVLLPIAESQLLLATARWLYARGTATLRIGNPQGLNLEPVLSFINECLEHLERLYGLPDFGHPTLADTEEEADVIYFVLPSTKAWERLPLERPRVLAPTVVFNEYEDTLLTDALPRPIPIELATDIGELKRVLTYFLQNLFRKVEFREGQTEIISRSLLLKPVVGLLPTAAGKSLCYQMVSLLQPGFTLVVQPLRSLMWDQQDNLSAMGIHRSTAIMAHGEVTPQEETRLKEEGYRAIERGFYFFVFVSPERFQVPEFRSHVRSIGLNHSIPYCVVDEAHCVSEWGHDFRPAYLNLERLVRGLSQRYCPVLIALTGTASQNVLIDIVRELNIRDQDAIVTPKTFERPELQFEVVQVPINERLSTLRSKLQAILGYQPGQPVRQVPSGLVFAYFVHGPLSVTELLKELRGYFPELAHAIELYAGSKPNWFEADDREWEEWKIQLQRRFKQNEVPIVLCTHSFGMGIDKPDIRFTIHAMLPRSIEEFYQQAGRAGRDGKEAKCLIIFSDDQPSLADQVLDPVRTPIEDTGALVRSVSFEKQGDALRNTWFLRNSFLGKKRDKEVVDYVWSYLQQHLPARTGDRVSDVVVPFDFLRGKVPEEAEGDREQQALEKALYRLLVVGTIADYMKDWTKREFIVELIRLDSEELARRFKEYVSRYITEGELRRYLPQILPGSYEELVRFYAHHLVDFVYDKIESRRRRAMSEMLQTARDAVRLGGGAFREQLLQYMEESEFTRPIRELSTRLEPSEWFQLLAKAEGRDGLAKLFGACRRQLEEFPKHPGLLLLRGFCRLGDGEGLRDIGSAFQILSRDFSTMDRSHIAANLITATSQRFPSKLEEVIMAILDVDPSQEMARTCYRGAPAYGSAYAHALFILVDGILHLLQKGGGSDGGVAEEGVGG